MAIRTRNTEEFTEFGNRLWALMESKGYDTPRKLATVLHDEGLVNVNQDTYDSEEEKRKNAIGSIEKKILKQITDTRPENKNKVQAEFILAYCKHFNCSADYLLGLTEIKTADPDIRKITELTGLTEEAILNLTKEKQEQENSSYIHKCWSKLLESALFLSLPNDCYATYKEAVECLKCKAAIATIPLVLKDEDPSSIPYNLIAIKEKPIKNAADGHYAAYYGMLYKLAQNITTVLDSLIEVQTQEEQILEREMKNCLYQFQFLINAAKEEPTPVKPDGDEFHFNTHLIF